MLSFNDITIVNIDGRVSDYSLTINALIHSQKQLPGAKALLLTPHRPPNLPSNIEHRLIPSLGYWEYSVFAIYLLHNYIDTEYALIVQDDGWVLNGAFWRDEYFEYDFIGAPTHLARIHDSGKIHFSRQYEWAHLLPKHQSDVEILMNGGFSLRSKKLLSAPSKLNLPFTLGSIGLQPTANGGQMVSFTDDHLEDVQICFNMRKQFEQSLGVKFAPIELARQFAFEHLNPVVHDQLNLLSVLGHHSKLRKLVSLEPLTVEFQVSEQVVSQIVGESQIAAVFQRLGYKLTFRK
jgi:Protein of unknown function (DUF5672)